MMRQSSSRIQRSKGGFRLKHALQICLLLAICTWLLYQIKHSHDKKRAFEERISKISMKTTEKPPELFNFGRKAGLPLVNDNDSMAVARAKEARSEQGQEEEGEQDPKRDENEDEEAKGDGGDGIDELDQDRGDDENEQEEEEQFTDEDRKDEDALFDNEEREDSSSQEAREENYKRDDVSSAVTHDGHAGGDLNTRGLDEEQENEAINGTVGGDGAKNSKNTTLDYVESVRNLSNTEFHMNGSHSDPKGPEVEFTKPENGSISTPLSAENTTISTLPENNSEVTAIPAGNLTESPPEYLNSSRSDDSLSVGEIPQHESAGMTTVQDQNKPGSEGHELEIHPQNSTTSENEVTAQAQPENLSHQTELSTLPVIKNEDKQAEDRAAE